MHVVSGLRADFGQQRAIDPVYDRSIHFTGPAKQLAVVLQLRDKNVLHLKIAARMKQRNCINETLECAGAQMESLIDDMFADKIFE